MKHNKTIIQINMAMSRTIDKCMEAVALALWRHRAVLMLVVGAVGLVLMVVAAVVLKMAVVVVLVVVMLLGIVVSCLHLLGQVGGRPILAATALIAVSSRTTTRKTVRACMSSS